MATVSTIGLVTGVAIGSATITATQSTISGTSATAVTAPVIVSIAVTPASFSIAKGLTQQLVATATLSDATTSNVSATAVWSTNAPGVATVSTTGLVTGAGIGSATITATQSSVSGTSAATVTAPVMTAITVTPSTSSLAAGTTQQMTATAAFSDGTTQNITATAVWSSNAAATTVNSTGLVTAVSAGTATITAATSGLTGTARVNVVALTSITVSPSTASVAAGFSQQFIATGNLSDGSTQNLTGSVTWNSSATSVATISSGGLASTSTVGSATITATLGAISGTASLTVTAATLVSISVASPSALLAAGFTRPYTATGIFSDGSSLDLTSTAAWSSSDITVATIDAAGVATGLIPGTVSITATQASITGTASLTVTNATLVSISVTPSLPAVAAGFTVQMTAFGIFSDGSKLDLTNTVAWTSSSTAVATVSPAGLATGVAVGTATITATTAGVSGSTLLTVTTATLSSITVDPTPLTLGVSTTQQMTATGFFSDFSVQDLSSTAVWSSSNTAVATVDASGLVTAVGAGTATITATSGTISGTASVTVTAATLSSIAVTPATLTLQAGFSSSFIAIGTFSDGSIQDITDQVTWTSSATTVAGVGDVIPNKGLVTAISGGTATITASLNLVNGTATVTVTMPTLLSITLSPTNNFTLARGFTQQMIATGNYSDGSTLDITTQVSWSSSNTAVATVDNSPLIEGNVTAIAGGTAIITATMPGAIVISANTTVTVTSAILVSIAVTPADPSVKVGLRKQFIATGTFSDSTTKKITQSCTWLSSDTTVASVTSTKRQGRATAISAGTTTISATKPQTPTPITGSTTMTVIP